MDDVISRQDAIRWVKTECNLYGKPTLDYESGKRVIEHMEQMPSADRWIPCSERLPETHETDGGWKESEKVLTIDDIGVFSVMSYEDDGGSCRYWVDEYGTAAAGVLAWMPLPEPWKGEAE